MTRRLRISALETWVIVGLIALWWALTRNSTSTFWPPLGNILDSVKSNWLFTYAGTDVIPTVVRIALGFGAAAIVGILTGAVLGTSPALRHAFQPLLDLVRAVPAVVFIPIGILLVGIGTTQKVFVVLVGAMWAVQLNTADAVQGIDPSYYNVAAVYGFRRRDRIFRVMVPAALPQVFAGLRVALAQSVLLVIVAEMISSRNGMGYFIVEAQATFQVSDMWSGILVLALLAYAISALFLFAEKRVLAWHRGWRASTLEAPAEEDRRPRITPPRAPYANPSRQTGDTK